MIKAKQTIEQALQQVQYWKNTLATQTYANDAYGKALKKQHNVNLYRAFMVYQTFKIQENTENETSKKSA